MLFSHIVQLILILATLHSCFYSVYSSGTFCKSSDPITVNIKAPRACRAITINCCNWFYCYSFFNRLMVKFTYVYYCILGGKYS